MSDNARIFICNHMTQLRFVILKSDDYLNIAAVSRLASCTVYTHCTKPLSKGMKTLALFDNACDANPPAKSVVFFLFLLVFLPIAQSQLHNDHFLKRWALEVFTALSNISNRTSMIIFMFVYSGKFFLCSSERPTIVTEASIIAPFVNALG